MAMRSRKNSTFSHRLGVLVTALLATATNSHVLTTTEESEVRVIPNPHDVRNGPGGAAESSPYTSTFGVTASCDPALLLSPHRIIRTPMVTQSDTLVEVAHKKIFSVPVPVYQFRQPARLSSLELPFHLLLVSDIDAAPRDSLRAIPVDPVAAVDSWFPGYTWAPVVYAGCNGPVHVGWKFSSNTAGEFFYALIVDAKNDTKASIWVGISALGEAIAEGLTIGTRAPAWMIDLLPKL